MIIEYHRPSTLTEALSLLNRKSPETVPLGGGLFLNEVTTEDIAVVDLQDLSLNEMKAKGKKIQLGAAATLQSLLSFEDLPHALYTSITHQETYNRRQVATLAGTLVACTGRSPVAAVFLALDSVLVLKKKGEADQEMYLGEILPLREETLSQTLITHLTIPKGVKLAYHYVARSPGDLPIVCAAAANWPSGRTRIVLGGAGSQPVMILDGPDGDGAEVAAKDAYSQAGDQWASAEYRSHTAAILVRRCLAEIAEMSER